MIKNVYGSAAAFFIACVLAPGILFAAPAVSVPEKVARGDAFVATAREESPVDGFDFYWRGKTLRVKAAPVNGGYEAKALLPVPLDEKAASLTLGVGAAENKKDKTVAAVRVDIKLYEKKRPTQKLTVDKKYVDPPVAQKERIKKDREKVSAALSQKLDESQWNLPFKRPVQGGVSSQFGLKRVFNGQPRSVHRGLDLRGAAGTPIYACADGQVALVDDLYFSGNTVYVNHGDGVFTAYLHMSEPKVTPGQKIRRGDLVGLVGSTGRVTGPHLHLSVITQGQSVDPEPLLEPRAPGAKER